jgi:hypothetical protein
MADLVKLTRLLTKKSMMILDIVRIKDEININQTDINRYELQVKNEKFEITLKQNKKGYVDYLISGGKEISIDGELFDLMKMLDSSTTEEKIISDITINRDRQIVEQFKKYLEEQMKIRIQNNLDILLIEIKERKNNTNIIKARLIQVENNNETFLLEIECGENPLVSFVTADEERILLKMPIDGTTPENKIRELLKIDSAECVDLKILQLALNAEIINKYQKTPKYKLKKIYK